MGEAVPEVEDVRHQPACGEGMDLSRDGELGDAELLDPGRAVAADLDQPVLPFPTAATPWPQLRVARVEVGPVGRELEVVRLRGTSIRQRARHRRQGGGGVELVDGG